MLRPRSYPELIGKALVLEAEPFITMTDDDEPWAEGLFFTLVIGLLVGIAQLIGNLLMTASLPPTAGVTEALVQGWRQWQPAANAGAIAEENFRQLISLLFTWNGYGGGWYRLFALVLTPTALLAEWLVVGAVVYWTARALGGQGSFNQTLGATALMAAPHVLSLLRVVPFVHVNMLLLIAWSTLIVYRAAEVTHDLGWRQAVCVALVPLALLFVLALGGVTLLGMLITL
jgi:hypothetical protein